MIPVTKPFLPPREEYEYYLQGIWKREWLTNNGPLVNELELKLKEYLELKHLLYVSNGTIAIQMAIKALDLKGEIITTPFSYVATTSSIVWEGCCPVFVDIHPKTFNIDPSKIEAAINENTSAILATHVYGNPCDIDAIQTVADKYSLKVIYDAAHCFGSKYKGKSVFAYGDISTTSFHATKLFHTTEGGAVFTNDPDLLKKMAYLRNFGHDGPEKFVGVGVNGKNSEFHAAMGLCNIKFVPEILKRRRELSERYNLMLQPLKVVRPVIQPESEFNFAYYPIIFQCESVLLKAISALQGIYVSPRRYFFPSLETLDYVKPSQNIAVSKDISRKVLCLPLYHDLSFEEVDMISRALLRAQNY
ncbi:DegT/DnrJ/EryC1/StrS aminotransferase family protein [Cesiribacter sp. SM1]|uniref:DegT/DnrJ/EryC1/StrS family aminotransferase n=1 Tax=Cesiribacter sp. SM1 TaxID=2861196 RepID=UPI001CD74914|nr:DegT/DnrJ/EryC1/StrS family aminotransferase [Cesiribacter sp. SM1]